jgi:hypothetical protein
MPDIDRYPKLGRKTRISGFEDALHAVREVYPDAVQHGSTGVERTWTIGELPWRRIVAHHWSPTSGAPGKPWWLRISPIPDEGPWFDQP